MVMKGILKRLTKLTVMCDNNKCCLRCHVWWIYVGGVFSFKKEGGVRLGVEMGLSCKIINAALYAG